MYTNRPPLDRGGLGASVEQHGDKRKTSGFQDFNLNARGSGEDGGRGARLLQTSILIGQEVQLSSSCTIRMSYQSNNNVLIS